MRKIIPFVVFTIGCLSAELSLAQQVSQYLISANAWMSSKYSGHFDDLMTDRLGTATANNNFMNAQIVRIGGWNYEHEAIFKNKEFFAGMCQTIKNAGAEPLVQIPADLSDSEILQWMDHFQSQGLDIKYYSCGNEPFLGKSFQDVSWVADYTKRISNAIRTKKPDAIIYAMDFYNLGATINSVNELLGTGANSITGKNSSGQYYVDVVCWHDYQAGINNGDISGTLNTISGVLSKLNQINAGRAENRPLRWAITEFNTTYANDIVANWAKTYEFWAGQYFAALANFAMQNGAYSLHPWSIQESGSNQGNGDLSMFNGDDSPRSTAVHWTLLGRTTRSTYIPSSSGQQNVTTIASYDENGYTLMIVNGSASSYSKGVNFSGASIELTNGNSIQVGAYETKVYLYDSNGSLLESTQYNGSMTEATTYPYVSWIGPKDPCKSYVSIPDFNSVTLQSENYCSMSGIQIETTNDDGGGSNIGYIDASDWLIYPITVTNEGLYTINFRNAGESAQGRMDIFVDDEFVASVTFDPTGGWQNWSNTIVDVPLSVGSYNLKLIATQGGFNLNWMEITIALDVSTQNTLKKQLVIRQTSNQELWISEVDPGLKTIYLIDLNGRIIGQGLVNNGVSIIPLANASSGLYFLSTGTWQKKVFIK